MRTFLLISIVFLFPTCLIAQKATKDSIRFGEKDRSFYLYAPGSLKKEAAAPLMVLLHGSGRNGLSLIDKWKDLASQEGFIIVGPDSSDLRSWRIPEDAPDFLYELIESLKVKYKIDGRRVYLFGHSAGAVVALYLSLMESEYFAATAVHAGAFNSVEGSFIERTKRKIPISIFVGTNDAFFPLPVVRETHKALNTRGFDAQLKEIKGHTHNYYDRSAEINKSVWSFLNAHQLPAEPKYERYQFGK
jgi:poly(3-hydroxybutyrate) depolymerase